MSFGPGTLLVSLKSNFYWLCLENNGFLNLHLFMHHSFWRASQTPGSSQPTSSLTTYNPNKCTHLSLFLLYSWGKTTNRSVIVFILKKYCPSISFLPILDPTTHIKTPMWKLEVEKMRGHWNGYRFLENANHTVYLVAGQRPWRKQLCFPDIKDFKDSSIQD